MAVKSKKHGSDAVLLFDRGLEEIEALARNLNTEFYRADVPVEGVLQKAWVDYRPVQRELRRLVQAWFDSGPNVSKLLKSDPILAREALNFRAHLIPTKKGYARLDYRAAPKTIPGEEALSIALGLFLSFLLNPYNDHLSGPCAYCRKYYVRKTKRQKVYCSETCGKRNTARKTNRTRRKREHLENLEIAKRSASQWAAAKTKDDWKEWVSNRTPISKNWLTRAVKNKELLEPIKRVQLRRSATS